MINQIGNKTKLLEKALDASWLKNESISNNIANVNTPGYKKTTVSFGDTLANSMNEVSITGKKTREKHIPIGKDNGSSANIVVNTEEFTSMRRDGNNIDVDVEMAELAKNTIKYNALINQLSREFKKINLAINGGR